MYRYETLKKGNKSSKWLPSVAINFNGNQLDELLDSYQTLKVSGRETIGVELISESIKEGTITIDSRIPQRELVVTYMIKSQSNKQFQSDFKHLRQSLTTDKEIPVTFADEPQTFYFGRLSVMETVPDDSNTVISTFTIHCDNPFKYGKKVTTNGQVTIDTFHKPLPEKMVVTIGNATNRLKVTDDTHTISATGTFNAGEEAVFYFDKEDMRMTVDDVDSTYMIDLNSDFENFILVNGRTLSSPQGSVELMARERWL